MMTPSKSKRSARMPAAASVEVLVRLLLPSRDHATARDYPRSPRLKLRIPSRQNPTRFGVGPVAGTLGGMRDRVLVVVTERLSPQLVERRLMKYHAR